MANQKVSALTAIVPADAAASDLVYVVDVSAGASGSKKMVLSNVLEAVAALADATIVLPRQLTIRQHAGSAGLDECQLSHDGSRTVAESKDGAVRLVAPRVYNGYVFEVLAGDLPMMRARVNSPDTGDLTWYFLSGSTEIFAFEALEARPLFKFNKDGGIQWSNDNRQWGAVDLGIGRASAGVLEVHDGTPASLAGLKCKSLILPAVAASFSGTQTAFAPTGFPCSSLRLTGTSTPILQGMVAQQDGYIVKLRNVAATSIVIAHESGGASAANRFLMSSGTSDLTLAQNDYVVVEYDTTASRWRVGN